MCLLKASAKLGLINHDRIQCDHGASDMCQSGVLDPVRTGQASSEHLISAAEGLRQLPEVLNMLGSLLLLGRNWFSLTELVLNHSSSLSFLEEMQNH